MINNITLCGKLIEKGPAFTSKSGEVCARCIMSIERLSGATDTIDVIIPDSVAPIEYLDKVVAVDNKLTIQGEIRTANYTADEKRKLRVYVKVNSISEEELDELPQNDVRIVGVICRKPMYRHTPLGRVVTDLMIAHAPDGKKVSYYIPCIAWENCGLRLTDLPVGTMIDAKGRYQSRKYNKIIDNVKTEMTAYEVSINSFEVIENEKD